jgi:hypothetical protein
VTKAAETVSFYVGRALLPVLFVPSDESLDWEEPRLLKTGKSARSARPTDIFCECWELRYSFSQLGADLRLDLLHNEPIDDHTSGAIVRSYN